MSIAYQNTPYTFQPVLSDGMYFTVSSSTDPSSVYSFRYVYDLYIEDTLVFQGKCTPNPEGIGIIDLQQVLETYTNSLPISYWDTTPIYTHTTFPFSRPANDEVIKYRVACGYEYSSTPLGQLTGFTGIGDIAGEPANFSNIYKTFRSTMGTNPNATLSSFNIDPFVMSGTPQGVNPTTTGLFLTNAPRIQNIQSNEYYTLGFTNYYLNNTTGNTLSEPYYVKYTFYDDQGLIITATTYENITTNGGGPRTTCNQVYQELYLVNPYLGTTDYNTLYVAAGPANIPNIPTGTTQYTVQLFGHFTGTTTPIQPTPTPTPTQGLTPTPTPTPSTTPPAPCSGCTSYDLQYTGESESSVVSFTNCITQLPQTVIVLPGFVYNICSCDAPLADPDVVITNNGACYPPTTPTPTPSATPSCICVEYLIENLSENIDYVQYIDCNGNPQTYPLAGYSVFTPCACQGSVEVEHSSVNILGGCSITPTPTRTPTKTPTPTPSLTPGCFLTWVISECTLGTCSGGVCTCQGTSSKTVYTNCSVVDLTDPDTEIYENTGLTNPFTGDFVSSGAIYNSTGANVILVCTIGGPC